MPILGPKLSRNIAYRGAAIGDPAPDFAEQSALLSQKV
jgi:hypothetical protein